DAADVDPCQPPDGLREMTVRARVVLGPEGKAGVPLGVAAAIAVQRSGREHQAGKNEFGLLLPVRGELELGVFHTGALAEGTLERKERAETCDTQACSAENTFQVHPPVSISPCIAGLLARPPGLRLSEAGSRAALGWAGREAYPTFVRTSRKRRATIKSSPGS